MGKISEFFFGCSACARCQFYEQCDHNPLKRDLNDMNCLYMEETRKALKKDRDRQKKKRK